jgi:dihydroorotase-like cyclic amidohydrolase
VLTFHAATWPRRFVPGTIAPGADADIVIWDAEADSVIAQDALHHHADYTPFEGMAVKGRADVVMSRGTWAAPVAHAWSVAGMR